MTRYAALLVTALALLLTVGGGSLSRPHPAAARAPRAVTQGPRATPVPAGAATREFTLVRPAGAIRLLSVAVPPGTRMSLTASIPGVAGVRISIPRSGPAETCGKRHGVQLCTQSEEACPMPPATWRLRLRKLSGPAGVIRVYLIVGPRP